MDFVTPEDVTALTKPTDGFLCSLSANTFGIDFLSFSISDYQTKKVIFEVGKDSPAPQDIAVDFSTLGEDMYRKIKYTFSEDVLRLPLIQTTLMFAVGNIALNGFRMIERHYFRDRLIKSFDFSFGFCIPGSTNSWDSVYSLPPLSEDLVNEMIDNPYETKSDSFYFVNGKLIMHNKASYRYVREDSAQAKKSYEDKYGAKGAKAAKAAAKGLVAEGTDDAKAAALVGAVADAKDSRSRTASGAKAAKESAWSKETDYI
jgi:hypothetical protein